MFGNIISLALSEYDLEIFKLCVLVLGMCV